MATIYTGHINCMNNVNQDLLTDAYVEAYMAYIKGTPDPAKACEAAVAALQNSEDRGKIQASGSSAAM